MKRFYFLIPAASLALAVGSVQAADKDAPGFNDLDKNDDGSLSRTEAAGNAKLAARFKEVDGDGDGKLSRAEYLKTMAAKDFRSLREKAADLIEPDKAKDASAGSGTRSSK